MANCNYKVNIKDIQSKYSFKIFCAGDNADVKAEIGNLEDLDTTAKNNLVSAINEVHSDTVTNATAISGLQSGKEDKSNKVTSISAASTDTQYPSAKCVYDSQETQNETISTLESNLEETQAELDYYKTIYNVLPKVSGNGESLTLNDTGESILKLDPRGQCKQKTTTGKNILNFKDYLTTNGATFTENADGSLTVTTTQALYDNPYSFSDSDINVSLSGIITEGTATSVRINLLNSSGTSQGAIYNGVNTSANKNASKVRLNWSSGGTVTIKNLMLESGASVTDYEPYTGGIPAPNPQFPMQIHEVSRDNEAVVCGKNLSIGLRAGFYNQNTGEYTYNSGTIYVCGKNPIPVTSGSSYTLSVDGTAIPGYFYAYDTKGNYIERIYNANGLYTPSSNVAYFNYAPANNISVYSNVQVEVGSSATAFEPFGDTYELNLGVDNLLNKELIVSGNTSNYEVTQLSTGVRLLHKNSYSTGVPILTLTLKPNTTYTFSQKANATSGDPGSGIKTTNGSYSYVTTGSQTITTESDGVIIILFGSSLGSGASCDYTDIQLEEGTVAHSYSEYGIEPIKMRGIGSYEDYFVRNSGKNIFSSVWEQGVVDGTSGLNADSATVIRTKDYISVVPNKHYAINRNISTGQINVRCYGANKNYLGTGTDYLTLISGSNAGNPMIANVNQCIIQPKQDVYYLRFNDTSNNLSTLYMMTEGDTQEIYEPYDNKGQWCKYNAIKEIVLDGETDGLKFTSAEISRNKRFSLILSDVLKQSYLLNVESKSNNFIYNTNVYMDSGDTIGFIINSTQLYVRFGSASELDTITKANAWLSTHNTEFVYILASPYLSPIESETLISQLDKVEKALGKDGQTNISQINNDAPFKIYASALKEIE